MENESKDELKKLIVEQQTKIDQIYDSMEKLKKYFFWTMVITIAFIVLPLVAMIFVIPTVIGTYTSVLNM